MESFKRKSKGAMVIINCVGGYGDILFCEPIFRHYMKEKGERPLVIIHKHQMWIQNYIDSARFSAAEIDGTGMMHHDKGYINLRYANQILRGYSADDHHDLENMMLDKYRIIGLQDNLWKSITVNFDKEKGEKLLNHLGSHPLETYLLINEDCQIGSLSINPKTDKKVIRMRQIQNYTLLDWHLVYSQADGIHTVSTSTFFLMQALKNKGWCEPDVFIYPRPNIDGVRGISQLQPDFNFQIES